MREAKCRTFNCSVPKAKLTATRCNSIRIQAIGSTICPVYVNAEFSNCWWPATSWVLYTTSCNTQSSAPEDGQDYRPKYVELIGIINKPLLLHLVGCLHYLYQ